MTLVDPYVVCEKNTHEMTPVVFSKKNTHPITLVDCNKTSCCYQKEDTCNDTSGSIGGL